MRSKLREARKAKNVSVQKMSIMLNISASFYYKIYYKIEQGIRNPTISLAKAIADKLDSTIDELFCAENLDELSSIEKPTTPEAVNQ